jgi:putative transposase
MRSTLVVDSLQMALARRRPSPGLIHHSDLGSQYVSLAFGRAARQAGIAISDGLPRRRPRQCRRRNIFATLKKELVNRRSWPSRLELQSAVFEYIEAFYNRNAAMRPRTCSPRPTTNNSHSRHSPVENNY